ncbi:hypothetical protein SmJEL517_g01417 [Synchytrium microbalum]|uniref:Uncharacterized protein n=1 Tax=Synchytrium microbalum TaxID=1806994 RepID=A0A507C9J8_9FUNG|nr:uncharacterized protein SmJEL517_g01417 [Synchytrium microbalum]TPX36151.1 hypothetical protein SmJEL517_g01417 [Synchytrium microbalum]
MSSLLSAVGCWNGAPALSYTIGTTSQLSDTLVSATDAGWICLFKLLHPNSTNTNQQLSIAPNLFLIGHCARITTLVLCRLEVDGVVTRENVLVTGDEVGLVAMWDLADGRCLQTNVRALNGSITCLKMTSSNAYFVCAGHSTNVIKSCNVFDDWTACMTLYPTGKKTTNVVLMVESTHTNTPKQHLETRGVEKLNIITYDGTLHSSTILDESKLDIQTQLDTKPTKLDFGTSLPSIGIETNVFDKNLMSILHRNVCMLYVLGKSGPTFLARLDKAQEHGQAWAGSRFMSARTILLWTMAGSAFLFYIGPESEIKHSAIKEVPPSSIVLFSDGAAASYCSRLVPGAQDYLTYRATTLLASFSHSLDSSSTTSPSRAATVIYIPPCLSQPTHYLASFQRDGTVTQWTFWASISGKELIDIGVAKSPRSDRNTKMVVKPSKEWNLADSWPLQKLENSLSMSIATPIQDHHLAVGYVDGSIRIMPLSTPFFHNVNDVNSLPDVATLTGHTAKVTSLLAPSPSQCDGRRYLISGSADCSVRVWDLEQPTAKPTVYISHSSPVTSIITIPPETLSPSTSYTFMSVSHITKSFSLFKPSSPQVFCRFPGFGREQSHSPLSRTNGLLAIHFRKADDFILFEQENGNVLVFNALTGVCERILEAESALSAIAACDAKVNCRAPGEEYLAANVRQIACTIPLFTTIESPPPLTLFLFNTKRLISDMNTTTRTLSPPPSSPQRSTSKDSFLNSPAILPRSGASRNNPPSPNKSRNMISAMSPVNNGNDDAASDSSAPPRNPLDYDLVFACFSALASWGVDDGIDELYRDKLGMQRPRDGVCVGTRGANGFLSIMAPMKDEQPGQRLWKTSPTISAAKLLEILAVARSILSTKGLEGEISTLLTYYGAILPGRIGSGFCFPSFAFLAKYWQDPIIDVQEAARTLFASTVSKMDVNVRDGIIQYWHSLLPTLVSNKKPVKTNMRAAVILGIITSDNPGLIPVLICKDVAQSLDLLIHEDAKSAYRAAAIELIGRGWSTWEPYVNGSAVFRHVVASTGLIPPIPGAITSPQRKGVMNVLGGGTSNTGSYTGSGNPGSGVGTPSDGGGGEQIPRELAILARQSVLMIATANPGLFASTIVFDLGHAKTAAERAGGLRLLGMFMAKKPLILYGSIPKIAEAIVRSLDPNIPTIREALLPAATAALAELVHVYPNASFHGTSQRLTVGGPDGAIVLYDLRTATRMQVLEGHTKPVSAVSFSSDGKLLASFSVEENSVRFWQPAGGLLGAASALAGVVGGVVQLRQFRTFSVGPAESNVPPTSVLEEVSFEWVSDRGVKLKTVRGVQLQFTV